MATIAKTCYFNSVFNVYFNIRQYSWNEWKKIEEQKKTVNGGTFRLTKYQLEDVVFYTFGFMTDDINQRPGHGGEWSSNEDSIKNHFGIELLGIGLDNMAVSVTYDVLFQHLNPDVYIREKRSNALGVLSNVIVDPQWYDWYDNNGILISRKQRR